MIVVLHVLFHMATLPFPTFLVLLLRGLVLWTPASSGTITQEERKTEIETETESGTGIGIGTERGSAPESERESATTVLHRVSSTVTRSGTDTGNTRKGATSVTEPVERKKSDTEKDGTERKRRPDTSHPGATAGVGTKARKATVTGDTSTKSPKEAKKAKKPAASRHLSRRARKLRPLSRLGRPRGSGRGVDAVNLIFLDNV